MLNHSTTLTPGDHGAGLHAADQSRRPALAAEYLARGPVLLAFHRGTW